MGAKKSPDKEFAGSGYLPLKAEMEYLELNRSGTEKTIRY
jgi:hypothetical protein